MGIDENEIGDMSVTSEGLLMLESVAPIIERLGVIADLERADIRTVLKNVQLEVEAGMKVSAEGGIPPELQYYPGFATLYGHLPLSAEEILARQSFWEKVLTLMHEGRLIIVKLYHEEIVRREEFEYSLRDQEEGSWGLRGLWEQYNPQTA